MGEASNLFPIKAKHSNLRALPRTATLPAASAVAGRWRRRRDVGCSVWPLFVYVSYMSFAKVSGGIQGYGMVDGEGVRDWRGYVVGERVDRTGEVLVNLFSLAGYSGQVCWKRLLSRCYAMECWGCEVKGLREKFRDGAEQFW